MAVAGSLRGLPCPLVEGDAIKRVGKKLLCSFRIKKPGKLLFFFSGSSTICSDKTLTASCAKVFSGSVIRISNGMRPLLAKQQFDAYEESSHGLRRFVQQIMLSRSDHSGEYTLFGRLQDGKKLLLEEFKAGGLTY